MIRKWGEWMADYDVIKELHLQIKKLETSDPVHASVFNAIFEKMIGNDAYLSEKVDLAYEHIRKKTGNPHGVTKTNVGLGNVTNAKQIAGLASGTTANHVVVWGTDGYTVKDSGFTIEKSVPANAVFTDTKYSKFSTSADGLVPKPTTQDAAKFLKGDGTWGSIEEILGPVTFNDSLIFKNGIGIRLIDRNGKVYPAFYFETEADGGIHIGNSQVKTKIFGDVIYLKSKSMVADNNNAFYYRNASDTVNMEVMNLDATNKFFVGNDTVPTKIRGTSVETDGSVYCGQNVVVNNEKHYYGKNAGGTNKSLLGIDKNNNALVGNDDLVTVLRGSSVRLNNASGAIVTSDRRKKHQIKTLNSKFLEIFMNLRPVYFRMKEGSQKIHIGFIAQEVEEAFEKNGISSDEFVALDKFQDESSNWYYGLVYEQFVALNTYAIQEAWKEISEIKEKLEKETARSCLKMRWKNYWRSKKKNK